MKTRIKIDTSLLITAMILTGFFYEWHFPRFYPNLFFDNILDLIGLTAVLWGAYLRMAARGYKKDHSNLGQGLVVDGPYRFVRNPMYLGSLLIGLGFVLVVWPWWMLPIFILVFYLRFNVQMTREEKHLGAVFGREYESYSQRVSRIFPNLRSLKDLDFREVFPPHVCWATKEKWGLLGWPALAFFLNVIEQRIIFGVIDFSKIAFIFILSITAFFTMITLLRKR